MLRHLRVTNFAILSDVSIELGPGMNVLTGETGAGKSLIVEAVNLLRGGRASADIPRTGAEEAVVEAVVEVPTDLRLQVAKVLDVAGLPRGDADDVFIRRVIQRGGRSRTYVNGALTTAAKLADLGALLIDLSGQHEHQGLVDPAKHLEIIDALAAEPSLLATVEAAFAELTTLRQQIATLCGEERQRDARIDFLRYQLEELDTVSPHDGEDSKLESERQTLAAADQLSSAARLAEELLYGASECAHDRIAKALRELDKAQRYDVRLGEISSVIGEAKALIVDAAGELRHYADKLNADPERLAAIDDRLAALRRLMRKHGGDLATVLLKSNELRAEMDSFERRDETLLQLHSQSSKAEAAAIASAGRLREARKRAAARLEREVGAALAELAMGSARLSVVLEPRELSATGFDHAEFLLASNKGEDKKPLAKVASGGELSRIMLALKMSLRTADEVATYVFDEVDTGIGGATAQVVGKQIRAVADHRQVLCVTHLPQIAAFADQHFCVEKSEIKGRTETSVMKLNTAARKDELARMLGGQATSKARAHAAELLDEASQHASNRAVPRKEASRLTSKRAR
jgi:DNA repair protein RecN (Recombination protein N)